MEGGRRELRIAAAPRLPLAVHAVAWTTIIAVVTAETAVLSSLSLPSYLLSVIAYPIVWGAYSVSGRWQKSREIVIDVDFLRLEEEGRIIWRTGWADIKEYRYNAEGWMMVDDDDREFEIERPEQPWPSAVAALSRSGANCLFTYRTWRNWPLLRIALGIAAIAVGFLMSYRRPHVETPVLVISLLLIFGGVLLAWAAASELRARSRVRMAQESLQWIKGEREVTAADLYPIRSILDSHPRAFVHKDVASDVRVVFRDGEALIEGSRRPADHLKLDDFVEEAEGSQLAD